jgi:hypothetical protein
MKITTNGLHYFGVDCGMLEFFTRELYSKQQLLSLPAFLEHSSAEKVCAHTNCEKHFLNIKKVKYKIKNLLQLKILSRPETLAWSFQH